MCEKISKFLTKRNWLICICFTIAFLVAFGIYFLVRGDKNPCKQDPKIKTAEDFKNNFGNEFINDVSKKYLEMVQKNYLKDKEFYRSILLELPPGGLHSTEIQYILKNSSAHFENIKQTENKTAPVELIKLSRDLNAKFYGLSNKDSESLTAADFIKIREKHQFQKLQQSKDEELYKTVKDVNENWRQLYKCIPHEYSTKYPQFGKIENSFKEILASDAEKSPFKIFSLFERIDEFFDNDVKVSQFVSESKNNPLQNLFGMGPPGSGFQQNEPRGPQFVPNFSAFTPNVDEVKNTLKNKYSGLQAHVGSELSRANSAASSKLNEAKDAANSKLNEAKDATNSKLNEAKNVVESKINQARNSLNSNIGEASNTFTNKINDMKLPPL